MPGGQPKGAGQSEVARGGGNRDRGSPVLDELCDLLSSAEIGLMDDARFAIDAGALDDVVVELVAFLLGTSEAIQGNTIIDRDRRKSIGMEAFLDRNVVYGVIQNLIAPGETKRLAAKRFGERADALLGCSQ